MVQRRSILFANVLAATRRPCVGSVLDAYGHTPTPPRSPDIDALYGPDVVFPSVSTSSWIDKSAPHARCSHGRADKASACRDTLICRCACELDSWPCSDNADAQHVGGPRRCPAQRRASRTETDAEREDIPQRYDLREPRSNNHSGGRGTAFTPTMISTASLPPHCSQATTKSVVVVARYMRTGCPAAHDSFAGSPGSLGLDSRPYRQQLLTLWKMQP
jgi:hypothetical protein